MTPNMWSILTLIRDNSSPFCDCRQYLSSQLRDFRVSFIRHVMSPHSSEQRQQRQIFNPHTIFIFSFLLIIHYRIFPLAIAVSNFPLVASTPHLYQLLTTNSVPELKMCTRVLIIYKCNHRRQFIKRCAEVERTNKPTHTRLFSREHLEPYMKCDDCWFPDD